MSGVSRYLVPAALSAALLSGCHASSTNGGAATAAAPIRWLCQPGVQNDPCTVSRQATAIVDGRIVGVSTTTTGANATRFDCFYVYPTVSAQTTHNADLQVQQEELGIAIDEASRFSEVCNVWAPIYRQITEPTQHQGRYDTQAYGDAAFVSVLSAWRAYLAHHNDGRPIVFIGHSQGTQMIARLLRQEIEPNPALRRRVLLAILVGGNVAVADTPDAQGSFTHVPPCRSKGQNGCVIGYSTFSETPPAGTRFGIPGQGASLQGKQLTRTGVRIVCTNPAALAGGNGSLDTYLRTTPSSYGWAPQRTVPANVTTPWVEYRGLYSAICRHQNNTTWLNVTRNGPTDSFPHLFIEHPTYGLHNYDVMLALGNLVDDVKDAEIAYAATNHAVGASHSGPTTPPSFARMFDGQCFSKKIFILSPPFEPAPQPVGAIEHPCSNSIAVDPSSGVMAVTSGAVYGKLSVSIYHAPYSSTSVPAVTFTPTALVHPRSAAWDDSENLWIADDEAGKILEFRPPFSTSTQAAAENRIATQPAGLAIDRQAGLMFVTDLGGKLKCLKTACHVYVIPQPYTGKALATLTFPHEQPMTAAVDRFGRLFVGIDESAETATINVYAPPFTSEEKPAFALDPGEPVRMLAFDAQGNLYAQLLETGGVIEFAAPIEGSRSTPSVKLGCPKGTVKCGHSNWAGLAFGP